ncbi:MAG: AraC family transcriptional regulator [Pseudomonadota bacterium]
MSIQNLYKDFEFGRSEPLVGKLADLLASIAPKQLELQQEPTDGNVIGRYSSISIDQYIHFFACDVTFEKDNVIHGEVPAGLYVGALFQGDHETLFGNELIRFPGNGTPFVLTFGDQISHTDHHRANETKRGASYLVAKEFFDQSRAQGGDNPLAKVAELITPGVNQHLLANPESVIDPLTRLMNNPYQGQMARLFVETTVIASLFSLAQTLADAYEEIDIRSKGRSTLAFEARHLIDNEPDQFGSINAMAARLGTNGTTLQSEFKIQTGDTIFQYVLRRRMQAARVLIRDRQLAISEVAYKVGYNSPASFSTAYKRFYGNKPAEDRL